MSTSTTHEFDAIIVGAGPAGCAAAAILAEHGRKVALLEKTQRRRYSVGESLIPHCWDALDRLKLVDAVKQSAFAFPKHAVQFVGTMGNVSKAFYFFQHTDHPRAHTWQVVREDFDKLLRDNAQCAGAAMFEETRARELVMDDGGRVLGVRATTAAGEALELRAPITIDATGRDTFAVSRLGWRVPDEKLKKMAIWTYFKGAKRAEGLDEGTTMVVYLPNKGWFWFIPLPDDIVSVGLVADKDYLFDDSKDLGEIFAREVARQPWMSERLAPGTRIDEFRVTSEFSYRSRHCATDGLVLIGDAFAFLDPVFSSGVYYALTSGVMVGDAAHAALAAGDTSAGRFAEYGEAIRKQIEPMRRLVYAFYDTGFRFGQFLKAYPEQRSNLTGVLIGDLTKDFDPFFDEVGRYAYVPPPLPYGMPLETAPRA
ncbi:MAG: NAD(P)/FAD-dependent oxidoreductase [Planctomycetota bacterium]